MQIHKININKNTPYYTQPSNAKVSSPNAQKNSNNTAIYNYLENMANVNIVAVKKVEPTFKGQVEYKNNLRTMIQNNESVMIAIAPRTFTAEDTNNDEKISLCLGEKPGTLLSAISRLDELKNDGINTIHILPIHPPGLKNAMGTAGSLYSPAKFIEEDGTLAIDQLL